MLAIFAAAAMVTILLALFGPAVRGGRADGDLARAAAILAVVIIVAGYSLALALASHGRGVGSPPND